MDTKNTIKTLSQSLLDEVKKIMKKEKSEKGESEADEKREHCSEALKGDQHKIDANKNGKVDAHDFKLLRKKKGVAETYASLNSSEEISEEEVEEAVKNPYAVGMAAAMKSTGDNPPLKKSTIVKGHEIAKKIKEETEEVSEEVEELDELSKGTLASYVKKAKTQMSRSDTVAGRLAGERMKGGKPSAQERKHSDRANKRYFGIDKAVDKLAKEEFEQIDELSKSTLGSYIKKASPSAIMHGIKHGEKKAERDEMDRVMNRHMSFSDKDKVHATMKTTHADVDKPREKALRRNQGIIRATNRLTKEELDQVELTQEEIDRLDAMMADLDEARGRPPKEGSDAWKRQQASGAAEQDEPRQHPIQQLERIKRDMRGGDEFKHKDGTTSKLSGAHASKLLDKYHGLKPAGKEDMQKEIHASQAGLKKHL